jgi:hypothetical protein
MSRAFLFFADRVPDFLDVREIAEVALDKVDIRVVGHSLLDLAHSSVAVFDLARQQKNSGVQFSESTSNFIAYPCCSAYDKYGLRNNE